MADNKIAIIGAGVSGISAAVELSKAGVSTEIYEARSSLGGRVNSIQLNKVDEVIDNGQHIMVGAYSTFFELLNDLGIKKDEFIELEKINIEYRNLNGDSYLLKSNFFKDRNGFLWALLNTKLFTPKEKLYVIIFSQKLRFIDVKNFDNTLQLLKKHKQSNEIIERLWEPLIVSTMNTSIAKASPVIFKNILLDSFFKSGKAGNLVIPKSDFGELVSKPAEKYLQNSGSLIFKNTPVKSITRDEKKFTIKSRDTKSHYDSIILATPAFITKKIYPELELFVPEYNPIISIYFWTNQKITNKNITSFYGSKSQWLFNRTQLIKNCSRDYYSYQITISNPDNSILKSKDSDVIAIVNKELNDFYKNEIKIIEFKIIREMFATFNATENNNKRRPTTETSINGLFLAGDWVKNRYPSTLEGASINGKNAAKSYLQYISR